MMEKDFQKNKPLCELFKRFGLPPHKRSARIFDGKISDVQSVRRLDPGQQHTCQAGNAIRVTASACDWRVLSSPALDEPCSGTGATGWPEMHKNTLWGCYQILYKDNMLRV